MELYVGGVAQGKTEYVLSKHPNGRVWQVDETSGADKKGAGLSQGDVIVFSQFHLMVRKALEQNQEMQIFLKNFVNAVTALEEKGCIVAVISDEVGNGIVPLDSFEREYRECVGRALVELAGRAKRVERVICGMGQQIK